MFAWGGGGPQGPKRLEFHCCAALLTKFGDLIVRMELGILSSSESEEIKRTAFLLALQCKAPIEVLDRFPLLPCNLRCKFQIQSVQQVSLMVIQGLGVSRIWNSRAVGS